MKLHRKLLLTLMAGLSMQAALAQQARNVILLIPDGTSTDLVTLSRWFNHNQTLAVDGILCGLVKTHSIDNHFPDSAPTSTAYATGVKSSKKSIGVDSASVPHISVLELSRMKGMSTGIVVTCEFPHATPADFVCHLNNRGNYRSLAKQFIFNSPSLVFAGGKSILDTYQYNELLAPQKIHLITEKQDFTNLRALPPQGHSLWALFSDWQGKTRAKSYECDRKEPEPSLSEMTARAIRLLSLNKNGFFLMVEGSQVDWACHSNDPFAAVTDFLEFDRAVGIALDFARHDSNTLVIACPDHANGGITMGNTRPGWSSHPGSQLKYEDIDIERDVAAPLRLARWSARKLAAEIMIDSLFVDRDTVRKYYNLELDTETVAQIREYRRAGARGSDEIEYLLGTRLSDASYLGWTTTGHTAEDVFLGIYAPPGIARLTGVVDNSDIGKYIAAALGLGNPADSSAKYYAPHERVFGPGGCVVNAGPDSLTVTGKGVQLVVYANTNEYHLKKGRISSTGRFPTLAVCIPEERKGKETRYSYYVPLSLAELLVINK